MTARRRRADAPQQTWLIHYGDVRVGTIAEQWSLPSNPSHQFPRRFGERAGPEKISPPLKSLHFSGKRKLLNRARSTEQTEIWKTDPKERRDG